MTVTLHDYWRSTASYRVRIALAFAGIDWRGQGVDLLRGDQRGGGHLDLNPQGLVPVLEIDGAHLTQSLAIVEYLDETRALGLIPSDPLDRARVRAVAYAIAMEIHPVCNLRVARFAVEKSEGTLTMQGWMREFIAPGLVAVERMIDGGPTCLGGRVSLADLCLFPQIYNARRWDVDLGGLPKIQRVIAHLSQMPQFTQTAPENVRPMTA